jgi:plasmid maintenance system antidote protein VapI
MQRKPSKMTPAQFQRWIEHHGLTREAAAETLGIGQRVVYAFLSGERRIPRPIALLCGALDQLKKVQR